MERYVDGFVIPVPDGQLDAYRELASQAGELWIEHGALEYFEGVGDDMDPEMGGMPVRTFPDIADAGDDETVVFSFIVYESRDHRDEVNEKVMDDPRMEEMGPDASGEGMPFDPERTAYGGFESIVSYEN